MTMAADLEFLAREANGLDLADEQDRAIFRTRVASRLCCTTVAAMREWVGVPVRSRQDGYTAVENAFIAQRTA
jgi:hypothetical protein